MKRIVFIIMLVMLAVVAQAQMMAPTVSNADMLDGKHGTAYLPAEGKSLTCGSADVATVAAMSTDSAKLAGVVGANYSRLDTDQTTTAYKTCTGTMSVAGTFILPLSSELRLGAVAGTIKLVGYILYVATETTVGAQSWSKIGGQ
jgi:hypothetical protein